MSDLLKACIASGQVDSAQIEAHRAAGDITMPPRVSRQRCDWQKRCVEIGFQYWRAPDSHGVECTEAQAIELLQELLGVEVEINRE